MAAAAWRPVKGSWKAEAAAAVEPKSAKLDISLDLSKKSLA